MGRVTSRHRTVRVRLADGATSVTERPDSLVVEEPLEIRLGEQPVAVTMRTPGHDIELVHGWLAGEGVISSSADVTTARYCAGSVTDDDDGLAQNTYNVIEVALSPGVAPPDLDIARSFYTTSSCGVCGKASIEALTVQARYDVASDPLVVAPEVLVALPDRLRAEQPTFEQTGGLHAAGLFTADGELLVVREDVGRHNAVDKVVGWAVLADRLPLTGTVLQVSGRASFELTQKAYLAGIPMLSAVSAPSSLAVQTAAEVGMTLAGFVRSGRFNLYTRPDRVLTQDAYDGTDVPHPGARDRVGHHGQ